MNIGLNPGPRARTVKPGPRHLRTRPDPGQNWLGPHKGIPSGEARQCTPAGTEAVISALAPTAPPLIKAAQNATTRCPMHEASAPPHPNLAKGSVLSIATQFPKKTATKSLSGGWWVVSGEW